MTPQTAVLRESIRASAGSGKTYALTGRYLQLIVRGVDPRRILATTFTRKAAGEILQRVLERLSEVVLHPDRLPELARQVDEPELTHQQVAEALEKLVRNLHSLQINTLDAYFAQVAGQFALELNLTPGWRMADAWTESRLVAEALEAALAERGGAAAAQLLRLLAKDDAPCSIAKEVEQLIRDLHERYLELGSAAWVELPQHRRLTDEAVRQALDEAMHVEISNKNIDKARNRVLPLLAAERFEHALAETVLVRALDGGDYYKKPLPPDLAEPLRQLALHARAVCVDRLRQHGAALQALLADFDRHLRRLLAERGLLRFADVTRAVAEGASVDEGTTELRLGELIEHVLLDEFQDTSLPQWRGLGSPVQRIVSRGIGSLVCVGDVKQAIYGFRGGEAAIAQSLPETIPGMKSRPLATSYRSSKVVIDAVNRCFGSLETCPSLEDFREAAAHWSRGFDRHEAAKDLPGYVALCTGPNAAEGEKQAQVTSRFAAEEIARLAAASPGRTWGVLVSTNKAVSRLVFDLRRGGVEASEEGQSALTDSPAVAAVLAALRLADHPGDKIARFHVSHTALGEMLELRGHDDAKQALAASRRLRRQLLELGYGATLARLCRAIEPVCRAADRRRLGQLIEMAYAFEPEATLRPGDFVRFVESNKLDDASARAAVRVMTIHQAKGLEFDGVVLSQLEKNWRPFIPRVVWRRAQPTGPITEICPYAAKALRPFLPPAIQELHDEHERRDVRENLCKLYVAMTRARYALHLIIAPVNDHTRTVAQMAGLVRHALAPDIPAPPLTTIYQQGDPQWMLTAPRVDPPQEPAAPSDEPIRLAPLGKRRRHVSRIEPSREGAAMIDLGRELALGGPARREGVLAHAALEAIEWLSSDSASEEIAKAAARAALASHGATPQEIAQTMDRLDSWLREPALRRLFDPASYRDADLPDPRVDLWRERAFAMRLEGGVVVGQIDRLVAVRSGNRTVRAEIVDFKTDRVRDRSDVEALAARHRPQLERYRAAIARRLALDATRITAQVAYLEAGLVLPL